MTTNTERQERNREWLWVGLLVGLAFAVRLALVLFVDRVVWGDEPFYLWLGRNWFEGRGYSFTGYPDVHHTPGYPFLSAVFYLLTGNLESASDVSYVLFGTLLMLPLYALARRIFNRQVGYIALLIAAVYPALTGTILFWGTMTEPPYYFFAYAALFALLAGMERRKAWAVFLAGLAAGAAYIVRPEGIAYFAILLFYLLVIRLFEKRLFTRRAALELLCLLVGFALRQPWSVPTSVVGAVEAVLRADWLFLLAEDANNLVSRLWRRTLGVLEESFALGWVLVWGAGIIFYLLEG